MLSKLFATAKNQRGLCVKCSEKSRMEPKNQKRGLLVSSLFLRALKNWFNARFELKRPASQTSQTPGQPLSHLAVRSYCIS